MRDIPLVPSNWSSIKGKRMKGEGETEHVHRWWKYFFLTVSFSVSSSFPSFLLSLDLLLFLLLFFPVFSFSSNCLSSPAFVPLYLRFCYFSSFRIPLLFSSSFSSSSWSRLLDFPVHILLFLLSLHRHYYHHLLRLRTCVSRATKAQGCGSDRFLRPLTFFSLSLSIFFSCPPNIYIFMHPISFSSLSACLQGREGRLYYFLLFLLSVSCRMFEGRRERDSERVGDRWFSYCFAGVFHSAACCFINL